MRLSELISNLVGARVVGDASVEVGAVRADSREVNRGDVFVAVRGIRADGHAHVGAAIERGAAAIVVERELPAIACPQVIVGDGALALGALVGRSLGDPARAMTLVGITGTNGKTTTSYLVESMLRAAGKSPGVIGTVSYRYAGKTEDAAYTTPTPHLLHETFARMREAGVTHVVMEVSSAALAMGRLGGVMFQVAAFSNLTQDHLDVHGSMVAYEAAKRLLFTRHLAPDGAAVVNVDDPAGARMAAGSRVLRTSNVSPVEIAPVTYTSTIRGIEATVATPRGSLAVAAPPLVGDYNVANILLAIGIGEALGLEHAAIARGIAELPGVPGRVERVPNAADLDILVDYAHTSDALRNVLGALRPLTKRRLICVFGCGGDRDPTKRPKMGAVVAELADLAVVTSDNPRTEVPRAIIDQILPAVPRPFAVEVDRRAAIRAAVAEATPGDVVVIAGKGHEDYQIVGTTKHHFDDREEAAQAVRERWSASLRELAEVVGGTVDADARIARVVIDSRVAAPGDLYVAIRGETHDGHAFVAKAAEAGATAVMIDAASASASASAPASSPATPSIVVGDTRIALGQIAREVRRSWGARDSMSSVDAITRRLVAVTGSAGKTTTKELIRVALAEIAPVRAAAGSLNNETGVPLTLLGLRPFHRFAVIEMGMRGAGQIKYLTELAEPDVAVVVNAGTAHIELLGSTDAIAAAKSEIWLGLRPGGTVVRPVEDLRLFAIAKQHQPAARHVTFGELDLADVRLVEHRPTASGMELAIDAFGERVALAMNLVGHHVAIDACAAIAAAHAAGAPLALILAGLARATPPSMRGEIVQVAGRHVIVDCYNANPASMAAALRTLAERSAGATGLAVVGDMLELGDHANAEHAKVGALATSLNLGVIALGAQAGRVVEAAGAGEVCADPAMAATRALARTAPGDWILLKASRGMKLERVLVELRAISQPRGAAT